MYNATELTKGDKMTITYENGFYAALDSDSYHQSEGYSRSQLMHFLKTPSHFYYETHLKTEKKPPTPAMVFGSLVHTLVLEPENFALEYAVLPEINKRTKAGKAEFEAFEAENASKIIVTKQQLNEALQISESAMADKYIEQAISNAQIEPSIFFTSSNGIQYKARPDAYKNGVVYDLKTTETASVQHIERESINRGYYLQAGMIKCALESVGMEFKHTTIIAIEKSPPYAARMLQLRKECIDYGERLFKSIDRRLAVCLQDGNFEGYEPAMLSVPKYAVWEEDDE